MDPTTTSDSQQSQRSRHILIWGLIMGLTSICYTILLYATNQMTNKPLGYLSYLITGTIACIAIMNYRNKSLGGYISFQKAYSTSFLIYLVSGVLLTIFIPVFYKYIAPDAVDKIISYAREEQEKRGISEEQMEMAEKYMRMFMKPGVLAIFGLIGAAISGAITSLIVAVICKKENKTIPPAGDSTVPDRLNKA